MVNSLACSGCFAVRSPWAVLCPLRPWAGSRSSDFVGDYADAGLDNGVGLCVADAKALGGVRPRLRHAWEEVVAGYDDDVPGLEAFVEFLARDGQIGEPEPDEESPFGLVDTIAQARKLLVDAVQNVPGLSLVERADHVAGQAADFT